MKTIGLIGGMTWWSSLEYYRIVNEAVARRLGAPHSAQCLMYSVDFAEIEAQQNEGRWADAARAMVDAAQRLERGGADVIVLCTNTMHKLAGDMERNVGIPMLHIADATAARIKALGLARVGLLGTRFTMEEDFYAGRLRRQHGLDVVIPGAEDRERVHRVIYEELGLGVIRAESRARYVEVIRRLAGQGAQGVILGCTEIGLLIHPEDSPLPVFDTTRIHAEAAADFALA